MRHLPLLSSLLLAFVALTACDRDPPIVTTGLDAATAQQLFERMDRLIAALQPGVTAAGAPLMAASTSAAAAPPASTERVAAAGPELAALAARVTALEQALELARGAGIGTAGAYAAPR